jgi:hypothetical protein
MDRGDLIEALAEQEYLEVTNSPKAMPYADLNEGDRRFYRERVAARVSVIVTFVARWMMRQPHVYGFQGRLSIVDRWRGEMETAPASATRLRKE